MKALATPRFEDISRDIRSVEPSNHRAIVDTALLFGQAEIVFDENGSAAITALLSQN